MDDFVPCVPETCEQCGGALCGEDPDPLRHQVIDIPEPTVIVTEYQYQRHALTCPCGGHTTRAELPVGVPESTFGVGLHAMTALLVGRFRLSVRLIVGLYEVLYGLTMSPASVCTMQCRVSSALKEPLAEAKQAIREAGVVGKDETGWRLLRRKASVGDGDGPTGHLHRRP